MIPNWLGRNAGLNVGIVRLPFCTESSTFARCRAAHLERMRVDTAVLEEFTPLFVSLLEQTYMSQLDENGNAQIEYVKELVDGDMAQVETKTKLKNGTEYSVNYKLNSGPTGWRVYDVVVEGVSIVNNYRAQFDRFFE